MDYVNKITASIPSLDALQNNKMMILSGVGVAVILFAIGYIYTMKMNTPFYSFHDTYKIEGMTNAGSEPNKIVLWYADWCPHCKSMKPDWETIKNKYDGKTVNGRLVVFEEINCTTVTPEIESSMDKNDVKGFPTIKLFLDDGTVSDFDAKPTTSTLDQFLNSML
jgi:thiol-disulfide isomerase/thioredoxin